MDQKKSLLSAEYIVAFAAVLLSLCALGVSIYQTRIMSQQQANSVWPYVQLVNSMTKDYVEIMVENKGVGPAKIIDVTYQLDGQLKERITALLNEVLETDTLSYMYSDIGTLVLAPGERHLLFKINAPHSKKIWASLDRWDISLCYCSVQHDCWTLDGIYSRPIRGCKGLEEDIDQLKKLQ